MQYSNLVYLLIGGNMGDRRAFLRQAGHLISEHCGPVPAASPVYETAAWGNPDQAAFLNQALKLETPLEAEPLMKKLLQIEEMMGRIRGERYGPRTIDIDILLYNNDIRNTALLTVPHPEMQNRRFALQPLADLAPALEHPVLKKTILQLLAECLDPLPVTKVQGSG